MGAAPLPPRPTNAKNRTAWIGLSCVQTKTPRNYDGRRASPAPPASKRQKYDPHNFVTNYLNTDFPAIPQSAPTMG